MGFCMLIVLRPAYFYILAKSDKFSGIFSLNSLSDSPIVLLLLELCLHKYSFTTFYGLIDA